MKKIFILEDDEERSKWFLQKLKNKNVVLCNSAPEAIEILQCLKFDTIFLDHDLGGNAYVSSDDPNTGNAVAKWIPLTQNDSCKLIIHSWNPDGAKNIKETLLTQQFKGTIEVLPFGSFDINV